MAKIAIIGGGVIGSAIAYYLALACDAADVVVIEPDPTYEFAATPRATGGIRQLFTVPENIRMAQYGHEIYGQFETLMAVDGDPAPIDFHREGYLWLGSGRRDIDSLIGNPPRRLFMARFRKARHRLANRQLADPNRARRPGRIARPQGRQAPLPVNAG